MSRFLDLGTLNATKPWLSISQRRGGQIISLTTRVGMSSLPFLVFCAGGKLYLG